MNVVVPALWFLNQDMPCSIPDMEEAIARRYADTYGIFCVGSMSLAWIHFLNRFLSYFIVRELSYAMMEGIVQLNSLELWIQILHLLLFTF